MVSSHSLLPCSRQLDGDRPWLVMAESFRYFSHVVAVPSGRLNAPLCMADSNQQWTG